LTGFLLTKHPAEALLILPRAFKNSTNTWNTRIVKKGRIRMKYYAKLGILLSVSVLLSLGFAPRVADAEILVLAIRDDTKERLLRAGLANPSSDYKTDLKGFLQFSASSVAAILNESKEEVIFSALREFRTSQVTAVLIRNVPIDPTVPPTPIDGSRTLGKATTVAEFVAAGISQLAGGFLIGYPWEKEYSHPAFHEGFALRGKGSAISTGLSLSYHSDIAYLTNVDAMPAMLSLVCLREGHDPSVVTSLVRNKALLDLIPEEIRSVLRERRFVYQKPRWIEDWAEAVQPILVEDDETHSILKIPAGGLVIPANKTDYEGWQALYFLTSTISAVGERKDLVESVHLLPGDVLVFKNKDVLHSRQSVAEPRFDGGDRVVIRSYWVFDKSASCSFAEDPQVGGACA
jgi:L-asparagine oxygenase